jgi:hypothetical protein
MQFNKLLLIVPLLALFYINYSSSKDNQQLEQWLELCPSNQFCFTHPKSLIPADVQSIDSIAGQLNSNNITLTYDLGRYSSQFKELTNATSEPVIIDGQHGKLLIQDKKMAITVPTVSGKARFSMLIEFKDTIDYTLGRKILKSIKFTLTK